MYFLAWTPNSGTGSHTNLLPVTQVYLPFSLTPGPPGEGRAEAGEVTVMPAPDADQGVMPPAEQAHRPWLVPGTGKL